SEGNAHPHFGGKVGQAFLPASSSGRQGSGRQECLPHGERVLALAHNGVIENYLALKEKLLGEGYQFASSTDTEVIAHLVARSLAKMQARLPEFPVNDRYAVVRAAVEHALGKLRGTYGLVILFRDYPELVVAARQGSPLVVGVGHGEHFLAS